MDRGGEEIPRRERRAILRRAFIDSVPVLMGYTTMGFVAGVLLAAKGDVVLALMTLAVNFRYAFYGFTMLTRWKDVPLARKAYLVLMLTDENYALEAACPLKDPKRNLYYCTALSVLNHSYWVVGLTVGAIVVCVLGHVVDPDRLRAWTNGMEFSMAALFIVIFTDQMRARFGR